ncbi:MAG: Asp-tRNA(Asn)/Glu-tRNA(Gln) amidotransferase subunit GatB [Bacteroidota bacterium]
MNPSHTYTTVIGLEVHMQLLLQTKLFAPEPATYGAPPNTHISTISLAHPGTLPVINKAAITQAIKLGLACHCTITRENHFARKNYFYPDLPKGYQITQDQTPICRGGYIPIMTADGVSKDIQLQRIHLEEDAGKSIHDMVPDETLLDFNRAGVALLELVTQPDMRTAAEACQFLTELRKLVRYLDVCDGNMEEGSLRCDVNISVKREDADELGQKVEVKNLNSISNAGLAIGYEVERQIGILEDGGGILAETRGYDASLGRTFSQRSKETAVDYRYFPEPDLPPCLVTEEWIAEVREGMPLLPREFYEKFTQVYQLSDYDARVLTEVKEVTFFFEELCGLTSHYKAAANWVMGPVKAYLNERSVSMAAFPLGAGTLVKLIDLVVQDQVSFSAASQQIFPTLLDDPLVEPLEVAKALDVLQEQDEDRVRALVEGVIADYPDKVEAYRNGKKGVLGMLMGEVMKRGGGWVMPRVACVLLRVGVG